MTAVAAFVVLLVAAALCAVSAWILVPAPTSSTLVLAVIAPEWAPYIALTGIGVIVLVAAGLQTRTGLFAGVLAGLAIGLTLPAIIGYPALVTAADERMRAFPGDDGWPISPYDPVTPAGRHAVTIDDDIAVPLRDGSPPLALDLVRPSGGGLHPAVVVIYGGKWQFGARGDCRPLAVDLARAGYAVVLIDYRHVPEVRWPLPFHDTEDALALVAREHAAWGIDPRRVAVLGRSAGAQLALLLASTPQPIRIAAAVGLYAPIDLVRGYEEPPHPDPEHVRAILDAYLGGPPDGGRLAAYRDASPLSHVERLHAPTLLLTGSRDEIVLPRLQRPYVEALHAQRTPTLAFSLPFANHAFDAVPFGRGLTFERAVLLRFLDASLGRHALAS